MLWLVQAEVVMLRDDIIVYEPFMFLFMWTTSMEKTYNFPFQICHLNKK
jgi:hypothetical protein